jgi:hypothetical protein
MENKQISIFDAMKYNERFNTVGKPAPSSRDKDFRGSSSKSKVDSLLEELTSGTISNVQQMTEDLLKLVFVEDFNARWGQYNYILRNINKTKTNDSGLNVFRSAVNISIFENTEYTKDSLRDLVTDAIERLISNTEYKLMKELVHQFRFIVMLDPTNTYADYRPAMRHTSDERLLAYFMSLDETTLKENMSLELKKSWEWLTFGPEKIMTLKARIEDELLYEVHMINNISFVFDTRFVAKVLDDIKYVYEVSKGGNEHEEVRDFRLICNSKRTSECK